MVRECTGIICKIWAECPHPELCQDECFDDDIVRRHEFSDELMRIQLGKLLIDAGLVLYVHEPGCDMKNCNCSPKKEKK